MQPDALCMVAMSNLVLHQAFLVFLREARFQALCMWRSGCVVGIPGIVVLGWLLDDGLDCMAVIFTTFHVTSKV